MEAIINMLRVILGLVAGYTLNSAAGFARYNLGLTIVLMGVAIALIGAAIFTPFKEAGYVRTTSTPTNNT